MKVLLYAVVKHSYPGVEVVSVAATLPEAKALANLHRTRDKDGEVDFTVNELLADILHTGEIPR